MGKYQGLVCSNTFIMLWPTAKWNYESIALTKSFRFGPHFLFGLAHHTHAPSDKFLKELMVGEKQDTKIWNEQE